LTIEKYVIYYRHNKMIGGDERMYVCLDCQHIFEEGKHYVEAHGLDAPPYEEFDGCPKCGGAYVEAKKCDCCGEYITGDYIKT
jgi:hypothetical protein